MTTHSSHCCVSIHPPLSIWVYNELSHACLGWGIRKNPRVAPTAQPPKTQKGVEAIIQKLAWPSMPRRRQGKIRPQEATIGRLRNLLCCQTRENSSQKEKINLSQQIWLWIPPPKIRPQSNKDHDRRQQHFIPRRCGHPYQITWACQANYWQCTIATQCHLYMFCHKKIYLGTPPRSISVFAHQIQWNCRRIHRWAQYHR